MGLLKPRKIKRWVHPYEAVYLLGLVRTKPGDSPEAVKAAEESAMENLARNASRWGIVKVKRGKEAGATVAYTEASISAYVEAREEAAA
jgi:hypothetical protein